MAGSAQPEMEISDDTIPVEDATATVVKFNTLKIETKDILSLKVSGFTGFNLTILDPPKVNTK